MLVMQVSKHPADLCPVYNDKYRALTIGWYEKIEPISAKHGVKFLGSYDDHAAHTVFAMFDTPSMDNLMKVFAEPEVIAPLSFCKSRMFPVSDHQATLAMIKKRA